MAAPPTRAETPSLRDRFRAETAEAILAAAEDVFAEDGLYAARMAEIAARAGVSVGTLYNHFADRDALLAALVERRRRELLIRLDTSLKTAPRDRGFRTELEAVVRSLFQHFEAHHKFIAILLQADHGPHRSGLLAAKPRPSATLAEINDRIEKLIRRGIREKALRADAGNLFPGFMMGLVRAMLLGDLNAVDRPHAQASADQVVDFFMRGAGADS